ncbi:MAG: hypothetical protein IH840_05730 [Candidatus Heimdallarchaeota archaeon]|nr:hypothetical protein [Candidatus Heimdallarchaeota archaeon]
MSPVIDFKDELKSVIDEISKHIVNLSFLSSGEGGSDLLNSDSHISQTVQNYVRYVIQSILAKHGNLDTVREIDIKFTVVDTGGTDLGPSVFPTLEVAISLLDGQILAY